MLIILFSLFLRARDLESCILSIDVLSPRRVQNETVSDVMYPSPVIIICGTVKEPGVALKANVKLTYFGVLVLVLGFFDIGVGGILLDPIPPVLL